MAGKENRVAIDTSAPFRSVKEAVALFGERVMAAQVTANRLSKMQVAKENKRFHSSRLDSITTQLEKTRQDIKRERENGAQMAKRILALEEELKNYRREIKELKNRSYVQPKPTKLEVKKGKNFERKKRHVTFADPLFAEILNIVQDDMLDAQVVSKERYLGEKKDIFLNF